MNHCPALLVSAPASGQGKTTVTAALARLYRNRGKAVRVFKTGPDFLDPMILERASGHPVYQLDLWMTGEQECRRLLHRAAGGADLILIEGVMGLFDGNPSSADLAALFGVPVLAVIDASAMAQTFGAVAHGLARYRPDVRVAGVLANRVAGPGHGTMVRESLPDFLGYHGHLERREDLALPDRHLGLVQARELADLDARLDAMAKAIGATSAAALPAPVAFLPEPEPKYDLLLEGVRVGVARDNAFSFIYPANLDLLRRLGARLVFFSPVADAALPEVDALWLPGGYPELHLQRLAENAAMKAAIRTHHRQGKPILAECGGMLYLLEALTGTDGQRQAMAGLLPGEAVMQERLAAIGFQSVEFPEGTLRGHTFHHSRLESRLEPWARGCCPRGSATAEAVFRAGALTGSYIHFYFPSSPRSVAGLLWPKAAAASVRRAGSG